VKSFQVINCTGIDNQTYDNHKKYITKHTKTQTLRHINWSSGAKTGNDTREQNWSTNRTKN